MKISELMKALSDAKERYGDLALSTDSGMIRSVRITATEDGVSGASDREIVNFNEIHIGIHAI